MTLIAMSTHGLEDAVHAKGHQKEEIPSVQGEGQETETTTNDDDDDDQIVVVCPICTLENEPGSASCSVCLTNLVGIENSQDTVNQQHQALIDESTKQEEFYKQTSKDQHLAKQCQGRMINNLLMSPASSPEAREIIKELQEISMPLSFVRLEAPLCIMSSYAHEFYKKVRKATTGVVYRATVGYCFMEADVQAQDYEKTMYSLVCSVDSDEICNVPPFHDFENPPFVVILAYWALPERQSIKSIISCMAVANQLDGFLPMIYFPSRLLNTDDPNHGSIAAVQGRLQFALDRVFRPPLILRSVQEEEEDNSTGVHCILS